eukprot:1068163-Prymnesium_polylepis.1
MRASSCSRIVKTSSGKASSIEMDESSWVNPGSGEAKKEFTGDGGGRQGYRGGRGGKESRSCGGGSAGGSGGGSNGGGGGGG